MNLTVCVVSDGSVYGPAGEEVEEQTQRQSFSIQMLAERLLMNMKSFSLPYNSSTSCH